MISKSSLNRQNKPQGQTKDFVAVRSDAFYGLKFEKKILETSSYKRGIVASPNFVFYDNYTKVMVDFSDYKNTISDDEIKEFFSLNLSGTTFSVEQGDWLNTQLTDRKISLSGTYTISEFKNRILFANVVDIDNYTTNVTRYDKNYFIDTPNFILLVNSTQADLLVTKITNILGQNSKNSFKYLGANIGDYISTSLSSKKFEIIDFYVDEEGKELIEINGELTQQDLSTSLTNITLHVKNKSNIDINNFNNTTLGNCTIVNGVNSFCLDNQTELQCNLRADKLNGDSFSFVSNSYCPSQPNNVKQQTAVEKLTVIADNTVRLLNSMSITPRR